MIKHRSKLAISAEWMILCSILLGTFTVILNNSSLNPAVPELMNVFQSSASSTSWIITIFLLGMGMTMPLTGYLGDRFGKKRIYLLGLFLFIIGSILGSFSWNLLSVICFRGLQGIAGGLMIPLSLAIMFDAFPKNERGRVTGVWGIAIMVAPAIGPTVGGMMIEWGSWQSLFWMNVPTGLLGLLIGLKYLPHTTPDRKRTFDMSGFVTVTLGVGIILWTLSQMKHLADVWLGSNLVMLGVGVVLLIIFVRLELTKEQPLLHLRIFNIPTYTLSVVVVSVQAIAMFATIFMVPLLVQNVYGYSAMMTGLVFLPSAIFTGIFVRIAGKHLDRKGPKMIVLIGLSMTCITTAMLGMLQVNSPIWIIFVLMMLRGVGLGLSNMPVTTAGLNAIPDQLVSQGSAMNNVIRRMTSSLGIVIISVYYEVRRTQLIADGHSDAFSTLHTINQGFWVLSIIILFTIPAAFFMHQTVTSSEPIHHTKRSA
ncbi:MDR family MFS transporter [Paenibacillus nuruki]|uniref:MDR family MFS transporter n=1 Tax=Paenibacillus nuruki TaxID=1886670 RepID=UPI00280466FA|nr:MDR family MFS transporter [Paenibacillus nuruki]CAJ1315178.1 Putative MFS-type transporter [Paenibacillus nuruki]